MRTLAIYRCPDIICIFFCVKKSLEKEDFLISLFYVAPLQFTSHNNTKRL